MGEFFKNVIWKKLTPIPEDHNIEASRNIDDSKKNDTNNRHDERSEFPAASTTNQFRSGSFDEREEIEEEESAQSSANSVTDSSRPMMHTNADPKAGLQASTASSLHDRRMSQPHRQRQPSEELLESVNSFLERRRSAGVGVGNIQPDLYKKRGTLLTQRTLSGDCYGRAKLRLRYDFSKSDLLVTVLDVSQLPLTLSEFLLRAWLQPELSSHQQQKKVIESPRRKNQTATQRGSNTSATAPPTKFEPLSFTFPATFDELLDRTLIIQLFDTGKFGRMSSLSSELTVDLQSVDPSSEVEILADLEPKSQANELGELLLGLHFLPSVERLTITLQEGRDLKRMDFGGSADPYVKVLLIQNGKVVKKKKSSIRKNTLKPVWNEALNLNLPQKALRKCHLELLLMDHDMIGNDELMGFIEIGRSATDAKAMVMWEDVLGGRPSHPVWLTLLPCPRDKRRDSN